MFNIGDIVQIRPDLEFRSYGVDVANEAMVSLAGCTTTVMRVLGGKYHLDIDNGRWYWTPEMLLPVSKKKPKVSAPQRIMFSKGDKTLEESVKSAIESIKTGYYKGTYLKLELEAQFDRGDSDGWHDSECGECEGEGGWRCEEAHERLLDEHDEPTDDYEASCYHCEDGWVTCNNCDGEGSFEREGMEYDDGDCKRFIREHVSEACRDATVYSAFCYDGSVDSEFMFTVPLSWEGLGFAIEYIKAFRLLGKEIGNGIDVTGAGMHITLLRSEDGTYPSGNGHFDSRALVNFQKNMNKLMPTLFLLASEDYKSRGLSYRRPGVEIRSHSHAIAGAGGGMTGAFEWRVFETCYRRPEMLYDFICVIAKGLVFYHPKAKPVVFKTKLGKLDFYDNPREYGIHKYFHTEKHISALNQGLKYLLPDHRQAEEVLRLRNFKLTPEAIAKRNARLASHFEAEWEEYKKTRKENEDSFVRRRLMYEDTDLHSELEGLYRKEFRKNNPNRKQTYINHKISEATGSKYLSASITI